jgi:hypothetical protein
MTTVMPPDNCPLKYSRHLSCKTSGRLVGCTPHSGTARATDRGDKQRNTPPNHRSEPNPTAAPEPQEASHTVMPTVPCPFTSHRSSRGCLAKWHAPCGAEALLGENGVYEPTGFTGYLPDDDGRARRSASLNHSRQLSCHRWTGVQTASLSSPMQARGRQSDDEQDHCLVKRHTGRAAYGRHCQHHQTGLTGYLPECCRASPEVCEP